LNEGKRIFWTRMIAGNYSALTAYFRRRIAQPAEAEDLVQEAYLRLIRIDQAKGEGEAIHNPEAYLFTVAENLVREHAVLRKRFAQNIELDLVAPYLQSADDSAESDFDRNVRQQRLTAAFGKLSERHQAVMVMHYRDGLTYRDIAEKLGVSTHMIKKYVVKALTVCRGAMATYQQGESYESSE
jgi:RNA polymerase sigma factor (sigma-70 family)